MSWKCHGIVKIFNREMKVTLSILVYPNNGLNIFKWKFICLNYNLKSN